MITGHFKWIIVLINLGRDVKSFVCSLQNDKE
jgi:hypothetical protein